MAALGSHLEAREFQLFALTVKHSCKLSVGLASPTRRTRSHMLANQAVSPPPMRGGPARPGLLAFGRRSRFDTKPEPLTPKGLTAPEMPNCTSQAPVGELASPSPASPCPQAKPAPAATFTMINEAYLVAARLSETA